LYSCRGAAGEVIWVGRTAADDVNTVVIAVVDDKDSRARIVSGPTNLRITPCSTDVSKPIIHRQRNEAHFSIPWSEIVELLSSENSEVAIYITGSEDREWNEVSNGIKAPSIYNLGHLSKVLGALDMPENHDVAFHSPGGRRLYADRRVLQRESPYFHTMFSSGFRESPSGNVSAPKIQPSTFEDSDIESDEEGDTGDDQAGAAMGQFPLRDLKLASKESRNLSTLVRGVGMSVIPISDASYRTVRAVLYYIYSEHIVFAPLSSSISPDSAHGPRRDMIRTYLQANPTYPAPVSAKSVYVLADKYELSALKELAWTYFKEQLTKENVLTELFSTFCRLYDGPRNLAIGLAGRNWAYLKGTEEWKQTVEVAKANRDTYHIDVMFQLLSFKD